MIKKRLLVLRLVFSIAVAIVFSKAAIADACCAVQAPIPAADVCELTPALIADQCCPDNPGLQGWNYGDLGFPTDKNTCLDEYFGDNVQSCLYDDQANPDAPLMCELVCCCALETSETNMWKSECLTYTNPRTFPPGECPAGCQDVTECNDGQDNDNDGVIDEFDPGCWGDPTDSETYEEFDNSEINPECFDGVDNDNDGDIDYPDDAGCNSPADDDERNPADQCTFVGCDDDNPPRYCDGQGWSYDCSCCPDDTQCVGSGEVKYCQPIEEELCPNGELNDGEDCDGGIYRVGSNSCSALDETLAGQLSCYANCSYNTEGCYDADAGCIEGSKPRQRKPSGEIVYNCEVCGCPANAAAGPNNYNFGGVEGCMQDGNCNYCGNGDLDWNEACDPEGEPVRCDGLPGFDTGTSEFAECTADCTHDTSPCTSVCVQDGIIAGTEVCDDIDAQDPNSESLSVCRDELYGECTSNVGCSFCTCTGELDCSLCPEGSEDYDKYCRECKIFESCVEDNFCYFACVTDSRCTDPDCTCEECGCIGDCDNPACCKLLECDEACQAITEETDCSDNIDNDNDGLIDCWDPDCNEVACSGPTCSFPQAYDSNDPDSTADVCCFTGASDCGTRQECGACQCQDQPENINLILNDVKSFRGEEKFELQWSVDCKLTKFEISRCQVDSPDRCADEDFTTIDSEVHYSTRNYIDEFAQGAFLPGKYYCYKVDGWLGYDADSFVQGNGKICVYSGDQECFDHPTSSETNTFCIRDDVPTNAVYRCWDNNTARIVEDCLPDRSCFEYANGQAVCRYQSPCEQCNGVFGVFADPWREVTWDENGDEELKAPCKDLPTCFMDRSVFYHDQTNAPFSGSLRYSNVDMFRGCDAITRCSDYKSQSACENSGSDEQANNLCLGYDCKWHTNNLWDLSVGVCVAKDPENEDCVPCDDTGLIPCDDWYCELTNCAPNGGDSCVDSAESTCESYGDDLEDCLGGGENASVKVYWNSDYSMKVGGSNVLTPSKDRYEIGVCKFGRRSLGDPASASRCFKDANEDGKWDGQEFKWDTTPPQSSLHFVMPYKYDTNTHDYTLWENFKAQYLATDIGRNGTEGSGMQKFRLCIAPYGEYCYPGNTMDSYNDYVLDQSSGDIDFLQSDFPSDGTYWLYYFAEDHSFNLEPVNSIKIHYTKGKPVSDWDVTYEVFPSAGGSEVLVRVSSDDLLHDCNANLSDGSGTIDPEVNMDVPTSPQNQFSIQYKGLQNGMYIHQISCKDPLDNVLINTINHLIVSSDSAISDKQPYGVIDFEEFDLSVTTSENGACEYALFDANDNALSSYREFENTVDLGGGTFRHYTSMDLLDYLNSINDLPAPYLQNPSRMYNFKLDCDLTDGRHQSNILFILDIAKPQINAVTAPLNDPIDWSSWYNEPNGVAIKFKVGDPPEGVGFGVNNTATRYCSWAKQQNCQPDIQVPTGSTSFYTTQKLCVVGKENLEHHPLYSPDLGRLLGGKSESFCQIIKIDSVMPRILIPSQLAVVGPSEQQSLVQGRILDVAYYENQIHTVGDTQNFSIVYGKSDSQPYGGTDKPYNMADFALVAKLKDISFNGTGAILFKFRQSETSFYAAVLDYSGQANSPYGFRLAYFLNGNPIKSSQSIRFSKAELEQFEEHELEIRANGGSLIASFDGKTVTVSHDTLKSGSIEVSQLQSGSVKITELYITDYFKEINNHYRIWKTGQASLEKIGQTQETFAESFELSEGVNPFEIEVRDIAGNAAHYKFNITKDNVGPTIVAKIWGESIDSARVRVDNDSQSPANAELNHPINFEVKARDDQWSKNVTKVELTLTCTSCSPNIITGPMEMARQGFDNFTLDISQPLAPGSYRAVYEARDKFQNSQKYTQTFNISDSIPPEISLEIRYNGVRVNKTTRGDPRKLYDVIISSNETLDDINATFYLAGKKVATLRSVANIEYKQNTRYEYVGMLEIPFSQGADDPYDVNDHEAVLHVFARDQNYAIGSSQMAFIVDTQCTEGLNFYQNQDWWLNQPYITTQSTLGIYGHTAPEYKVTLLSSQDSQTWEELYAAVSSPGNMCSSDERSPMQQYAQGVDTIVLAGTTSVFNPGNYLSINIGSTPLYRSNYQYYRIESKVPNTQVSTQITITPPLENNLPSNAVLRSCQYGQPAGWFGTSIGLREGELKLRGIAEDDIGNICSEFSPTYVIISDQHPPEFTEVAPQNGDLIGKNDTNITIFVEDVLSGVVKDDIRFVLQKQGQIIESAACGSSLSCTSDGNNGYRVTYTPQSELADGIYQVNLTASDFAGWEATHTMSFEIDQDVPTITDMRVTPGLLWPDGWYTAYPQPQVLLTYECQSSTSDNQGQTSDYGVFRTIQDLGSSQYKVTLKVRLPPDVRFYVLEEIPETEIAVIDAGIFTVDSNNHLKHVVFQNAQDTDLEFTLESETAPEFSGVYSYEGMTSDAPILDGEPSSQQQMPSQGEVEVTNIEMLTSDVMPSVTYAQDNPCQVNLHFAQPLTDNQLHKFRISTRQKIIKNGQEIWSSSSNEQKSFYIDTNIPSVSLEEIPVTNDEEVHLQGTFSDEPDNMGYLQAESTNLVSPRNITMNPSGTFSETISLDYGGEGSVTVKAVDKAGNSDSASQPIDYDVNAPTISNVRVYTEFMFENPSTGQIILNNRSILVRGSVNELATVYANVTNLDDTPQPGAYYDKNETLAEGTFELALTLRTLDDYSNHSLIVAAVDKAGNPSQSVELKLTYDDRGPTAEFIDPPRPAFIDGRDQPHFTNDDTPTLKFRTNMPSRCTIDTGATVVDMPSSQEGMIHTYSYPSGVPRQEDVVYQFSVTCYSSALNAEGTMSSSFVVDKTPPSLSFEAHSGNIKVNQSGDYQIFEVTDNFEGELQAYMAVHDNYLSAAYDNDVICESYTCTSIPHSGLCPQENIWGNETYPLAQQLERLIYSSTDYNEYSYTVTCKDRAGNPAEKSATIRVDVHRTYGISSITPRYTSRSMPLIEVKTNMATEYCQFSFNGQNSKETPDSQDLQSISYEFDEVLEDGSYAIQVTCSPYNAYARDASMRWVVQVDSHAPIIEAVSSEKLDEGFNISWTARDPSPSSGIANYSYVIDNRAGTVPPQETATSNESVVVYLADGEYYFHIRAKDNAGNLGETEHYPLSIDTKAPERIALSVTPNPVKSNSNAQLQGTVYKEASSQESQAKVDIFTNDIYRATINASYEGVFTYDVPVSGSSMTIKAAAVDSLGNGPTNASIFLKVISSGPKFSHMVPPESAITSSVDSIQVFIQRVDDAGIDASSASLELRGQSTGDVAGSIQTSFTDGTNEMLAITFTPESSLADDTYIVSTSISDTLGNTEEYEKSFRIDANALHLELSPEYNGPVFTTQQDWTFTGSISGQAAAQSAKLIMENNEENKEVNLILSSQTFSIPVALAEQENRLQFQITDENGGLTSSGYLYYIYDTKLPRITITRPANALLTDQPSTTMFGGIAGTYQEHYFTYNGQDRVESMETLRFLRNGQQAEFIESPYDNTFLVDFELEEGLNRIEVVGSDKAGLQGSAYVNITLDSQAPFISITSVKVDPEFIKYEDQGVIRTNADRLIISGTYSDDNFDRIYLKGTADQASTTPQGTFQINVSTNAGTQAENLTLVAVDLTGHESEASIAYIVDTEGPQVESIHPAFTQSQTPFLHLRMDERTSQCSVAYQSELGLEFVDEAVHESERNMTVQISQTLANNDETDLTMACIDPLDNERTTVKPVQVDNSEPTILDLTITEGAADLENSSAGLNEYLVYSGGMLDGRRVAVIKLKAEADEPVRCRYSRGSIDYEDMESDFDGFYDYMFAPITDNIILEDNTTTIIHASCEDRAGNTAGNYFSVKIKVNLEREVHLMDLLPDGFTTSTDVELSLRTMPEAYCHIDRALYNGRVDNTYAGMEFEQPSLSGQTASGRDIYQSILPLSLTVGEYIFEVACTDPDEVFVDGEATISFNVIPEFSLEIIHPRHGWSSTQVFDVHLRSSRNAECRYDMESGPYRYLNFNFSTTDSLNHYLYNKGPGIIYVSCKDSYGYEMPTKRIVFSYDPTAPEITQAYAHPNPVNYLINNTLQTTMHVHTDDMTVCKYSALTQNYSQMQHYFEGNDETEADTFKTRHQAALVDLDDRVSYTYYVGCENLGGAKSSIRTIRFDTDRTADLSVSIISPRNGLVTGEDSFRIEAITNKPASCTYGNSSSPATPMPNTGYVNHSTEQIGNVPEGQHTLFVKCTTEVYEAQSSTTFVVDLTPPLKPVINDSYNTCYLTWLKASWEATEDTHEDTYVERYFYAIGTSSGSGDVVNWTDAGSDKVVTRSGLDLENGETYYWSVIAQNNAGRNSTRATSKGVRMDNQSCPLEGEPTCYDGRRNGMETGVDCGGPCTQCPIGEGCDNDEDCISGYCNDEDPNNRVCEAALCENGRLDEDNGETGVDCGGSNCEACEDGASCDENNDCLGGWCDGGECKTSSCTDGVKNGDESSIDCGGDCDACELGDDCNEHTDCVSGVCSVDGLCVEPTCNDDLQTDGFDTDYDCGGECPPCDEGERCNEDADCLSGNCELGYCEPGTDDSGQITDEDNDGMDDDWERENGLDPTRDDAWEDSDGDGLNNYEEYYEKTDPQKSDTDGDSFMDGEEVLDGYDPLDPSSYPGSEDEGGSIWMTILIIVLVLALLGGGGYYGYMEYQKRMAPPTTPGRRMPPPGPGGRKPAGPQMPPPRRGLTPQQLKAQQERNQLMQKALEQRKKSKQENRSKAFEAFEAKANQKDASKSKTKAESETKKAQDKPVAKKGTAVGQKPASAKNEPKQDWIPIKLDQAKLKEIPKGNSENQDAIARLAELGKKESSLKRRNVFDELDKLSPKKEKKSQDIFDKLSESVSNKKKTGASSKASKPKTQIVDLQKKDSEEKGEKTTAKKKPQKESSDKGSSKAGSGAGKK